MANLSEENLRRIAHLLPRLFEVINLATATEFNLFTQYGETEETLPELGELRNAAERAKVLYNRIYELVLQIAETQPVANSATLNFLYQSIEQAEPVSDAIEASVVEVKRSWELP